MVCEKCRRVVVSSHECDGDPRSTCLIYGCGRPIVRWSLVETHGDGRKANLGECERHAAVTS